MKQLMRALSCSDLPKRDKKNAVRVNFWCFAWAAALLIASYFSSQDWYGQSYAVWIAFCVVSALGVTMVLTYKKCLREMDELERKVQLDALGFAVGGTLVCFASYSVLDEVGILPELGDTGVLLMLVLTYGVALTFGRIRYR